MRISDQVNFTRKNEAYAFKYESHNLLQKAGIIKKLPSSEIAFSSLGSYYFYFFEALVEKGVMSSRGYARIVSTDPEDFLHNEVKSIRSMDRGVYSGTVVQNDDFSLSAGLFRPRTARKLTSISYFEDESRSLSHSEETIQGLGTILFGSERIVKADGHRSSTIAYEDEAGTLGALRCTSCGRISETDSFRAAAGDLSPPDGAYDSVEAEMVHTPDVRTIDDVSTFFGQPKGRILKTVVVQSAGAYLAILLSGDRELSLKKLAIGLGVGERSVSLVPKDRVEDIFGVKPGFIGPVGLPDHVRIIADHSVADKRPDICGGGKDDYHLKGAVMNRDYSVRLVSDVSAMIPDDACPSCGERSLEKVSLFPIVRVTRGKADGVESLLRSSYTGRDGAEAVPYFSKAEVLMEPLMSAVFETHTEDGVMILPDHIAPLSAGVCPVSDKDEAVTAAAERIYDGLLSKGVRVYMNDASERAGVKFNLDDKLGSRFRVTVGKSVSEGTVELRDKAGHETRNVIIDHAAEIIVGLIGE